MNRGKRTEIATLGEFGLIEHLTSELTPINKESIMGVGDDAAILHIDNQDIERAHYLVRGTPLISCI